ncbi:hypothetical protein D623_10006203 [Myotis brandtii]|uniref:Uncharacterized protein n=1 Tax=Myotis brandtii TaxID=109478 RepID=S7N1H7_MYOBR|nr:hypothetical protein D623_10006203 [Myotis brandtii]
MSRDPQGSVRQEPPEPLCNVGQWAGGLSVQGTRSFRLCLRLFLEGKEGKPVMTVCGCFGNGKPFRESLR